jgi:hypothetical protein
MDVGKKVVLAGLIFSLVVFAFFIWIAVTLHRRLQRSPTNLLIMNPGLHWQRYMLALYVACFVLMVRNLVRTIQFGASKTPPINTKEVYIYVFDGFLMFFSMLVLIVYHPGLLIKKARRWGKAADFHEPLTSETHSVNVPLAQYEPRMMAA